MKKIFFLILGLFLITGCGNANNSSDVDYKGTKTDLSSKFLSKGYLVNVYRSSTPLGDDAENYGKAYVTMEFNVITEIISMTDYEDKANYIKKKEITNVRLIKTPKMGIAEDIIADYGSYGENFELKGSNNKYTKNFDEPIYFFDQTSLGVRVNQIALLDSKNYGFNENPSLARIYGDLGITRDNVALTLGFRIELTTVSGKILYKDFEVIMPPVGFDIADSEFQVNYMTEDVTKMESFLEKN